MKISSEFQYIFLAGYGNSLDDHWQAQWFVKFPNAIWVEQADWDYPVRDDWVNALDKAIQKSELPVVIVAHSLGCLTFIEWVFDQLQKPKSDISKIQNAFLVAPPDCERDGFPAAIKGFEQVRLFALPIKTTVVVSSNDPYCALHRGELFIDAWKAKAVRIGNAVHINASAGYGAWQQGLEYLNELLTYTEV